VAVTYRRPRGLLPLFLPYCTAFLIAQLLLLLAGTLLWERVLDTTPVSTLHYRVQGSHALLAERLLQVPDAQRPAMLEKLQHLFAYPLHLQPLETVARQLPGKDADRLRDGQIVISDGGAYSHQRLAGTTSVLTLGDFGDVPADSSPHDVGDELSWIALLSTLGAAIALPLYFLIYRFWHDVRMLHEAVQHLRANTFQHVTPALRTRLLRPLGHAMADLAQQLRILLDGQRLMSQAMAHELRTPLARLRFTAQLMDEHTQALQGEQAALLRELQTDLQLLQDLTAASVEYMRFGRMPLVERSRVEVRGVLEAAIAAYAGGIPAITLACNAALQVHANAAALELAARNLIANAVRHARGQVQVIAAEHDGGMRLTVEDDGAGVHPSQREQVFAPYVRLSEQPGGFGLGLAMVRVIAERHGGHARMGNSALGGAAVVLWLPDATDAG